METAVSRTCSGRNASRYDDTSTRTSSELEPAEARAMLSEMSGTPLGQGTTWDDEARTRLADFQRSEGLPATGDLDDVTVDRLRGRFERVSASRAEAIKSPSAEEHAHVAKMLQEATHAAENLAHQFAHDAPLRQQYMAEVRAHSQTLMAQYTAGEMSAADVALEASRLRNNAMLSARGELSPAGKMLSNFLKLEGATFTVLSEKYAEKLFGKSFTKLTAAEQGRVHLTIAERAGMTNRSVNGAAKLAGKATTALMAVTIAVAIYQVASAEDKVGETLKQGASLVGFWAGAKVGAFVGGAVCGPPCAVVGGIAGGLLGAAAAEHAVETQYHAIKG